MSKPLSIKKKIFSVAITIVVPTLVAWVVISNILLQICITILAITLAYLILKPAVLPKQDNNISKESLTQKLNNPTEMATQEIAGKAESEKCTSAAINCQEIAAHNLSQKEKNTRNQEGSVARPSSKFGAMVIPHKIAYVTDEHGKIVLKCFY